ncbi:hypothetical protein E2C01_016526 [Portunus trituberculatus]|uniref:Uncharacterized protein n=1 Tax=Portunus trituberculatus TaxID=210409 RepID=A0A5B7DRB6_PORTR|nr:hypothetical protein [Portunus trituberculatus]
MNGSLLFPKDALHLHSGDVSTCLFNLPHEDESLPRVLPGKLLSVDAQCKKDRGTSACFVSTPRDAPRHTRHKTEGPPTYLSIYQLTTYGECEDRIANIAGTLTCREFLRTYGFRYCGHRYIHKNCCRSQKEACNGRYTRPPAPPGGSLPPRPVCSRAARSETSSLVVSQNVGAAVHSSITASWPPHSAIKNEPYSFHPSYIIKFVIATPNLYVVIPQRAGKTGDEPHFDQLDPQLHRKILLL